MLTNDFLHIVSPFCSTTFPDEELTGERPLAPKKISLSAAKTGMRITGLAGSHTRTSDVLDVLSRLGTRFRALAEAFPNMSKTIELMLDVALLDSSRDRHTKHSGPYREVNLGVCNFVEWLIHHPKSHLNCLRPEPEVEMFLDVIAVRWVYSLAMRSFGDQISHDFYNCSNTPDEDFQEIARAPDTIAMGAERLGYEAWIASVEALAPDSNLLTIFLSLKSVKEVAISRPPPHIERQPPTLSERGLSPSNWYYPSPQEFQGIRDFLTREDLSTKRSKFRHEAFLIYLSISFCRPIQAILNWPVYHNNNSGTAGTNRISIGSTNVYWLKAEHGIGHAVSKIGLGIEARNWFSLFHPQQGHHTLHDLLPFSDEPWANRAYDCLAAELGCHRQRAKLITRDLLPRLIYKNTSNSALVQFWRTDLTSKVDRADRISLSHYLQLIGKRVSSSYTQAITEATGSWAIEIYIDVPTGSRQLSLEEVKAIVDALTRCKREARSFTEKHNAIVFLTLFICMLSTGHRRSKSPFPFPWDFSPSEGLVFICDKRVTGSEARFVPLAPVAMKFMAEYSAHLKHLSEHGAVKVSAKNYAQSTHELLGFEVETSPYGKQHEFTPHAGVFFLLTSEGQISEQVVTTSLLDRFIENHTGIHHTSRSLRTTMAQHLWEKECSGRAVQAFLGHQPEMHVHGPSSTWSVLDVAEMVIPKIDAYLLQVIEIESDKKVRQHFVKGQFSAQKELERKKVFERPWCAPRNYVCLKSALHDPSSNIFAPGYEGRERDNVWAEQRARAVIRREISEYMLSSQEAIDSQHLEVNQEVQFTSDDRKRIEDRVRSELNNDPIALKKVRAVLERLLNHKNLKTNHSTFSKGTNYHISSPGPVDIHFSRSLRCALGIRSIWEQSVGRAIGNPSFDELERIAHLAISLICFDSVLAIENLEGLVLAAAQGFETHGTQITIRCRVVTNTHDYEFSIRPGMISTALALGCASRKESCTFEWSQIETRVSEILHKLMRLDPGMKWSTSRLCQVFRPYWLIRQPGSMYSISIGEHKGPAPDARAEAQLNGLELTSEIQDGATRKFSHSGPKDAKNLALAALKKLFSNARGILERGEHRRAVQRAKLKVGLRSQDAEEALYLGRDTQIVGLLLSFIGRLLDTGGPRKTLLAPSSIEGYFAAVATELIEQAWDFDFESAEPHELLELLNAVSEKINPKSRELVLRLFCNHLRDELSISMIHPRWFSPREPVRTRSSLVLPDHITKAIGTLKKQPDEIKRNAAILIAVCFGYGLRRLEAFGLTETQFDTKSPLHLSVKRTQISDLKSSAGRRVIPGTINRKSVNEHLMQAVKLARTTSRNMGFLFESPTREDLIAQVRPITSAATEALRRATGTVTVVLHTLRHSFSTILGLGLFAKSATGTLRELDVLKIFYLSERNPIFLDEILKLPKDWPFGVDAVATALGHADSSTFLNVYFHGSHLVIADRCEYWQPKRVTQVRLASMLSKERTALSKLWKKLNTKTRKHPFDAREIVKTLVARESRYSIPVDSDYNNSDTSPMEPSRWDLFVHALQYRQEQDLSLEGMKSYAIDGLDFGNETVDRFLHAYEQLVLETALDDFEPASSELITPAASHQEGVARGTAERKDFIARSQAWASSTRSNAMRLRELLENWRERIKTNKPTIVCRSLAEFDESLDILRELGVDTDQLVINVHGDVSGSWLINVLDQYPKAPVFTNRASRGSTKVKIAEVSIAIRQKTGSLIPDGRDLHRALAGVYVAMSAQGPVQLPPGASRDI